MESNATLTFSLNDTTTITTNTATENSSSENVFCVKHAYALRMGIGLAWLGLFVIFICGVLVFIVCKLRKKIEPYTKLETKSEETTNSYEDGTHPAISDKLYLRAGNPAMEDV